VATFGQAKACTLSFNYGGPSHLDTRDPKADAPSEVRGEFGTIRIRIPQKPSASTTRSSARLATGTTTTHRGVAGPHRPLPPRNDVLGIESPATPADRPSVGSVVAGLRPVSAPAFPYVTLGDLQYLRNRDVPNQNLKSRTAHCVDSNGGTG
jgi:hypothetical protein